MPLKHETIASTLEAWIYDGRWSPGQRLPAESELAQLFEVAKPTVRHALATLQTRGLVVARQGVGRFVVDELPDWPEGAPDEQPNLLGLIKQLDARVHWLETYLRQKYPDDPGWE